MVSGLGNATPSASANGTGAPKISFGGIASGIDTNAIIDALIQVAQRPITDAQAKLAKQQQRQNSLATITSSIANLAATAAGLKDTTIVGAKRATTSQLSSEAQKLSASASSTAAVGSFTVDVLALATATRTQSTGALGTAVTQNVALASAGFALPVTVGTFSVNGTAITIDAATVLSDGADLPGANTILAKINNAGIGVTASVVNDGDGRANLLQLTSGGTIQLGSGGDTSNFLAAANLLQSPGTTTRTSTRAMAGVAAGVSLENGRLATALAPATGSFTVNGVSIAWDRTADSLTNVISRINSSGAGVNATFDTLSDRLVFTSTNTGSSTIAVADVAGNFLAATGVLAATPTLGANASYKINGGDTQYASTNTVSNAVTGVSLSLVGLTTSAVTVNVNPDNSVLKSRLQSFVSQFNSTTSVLGDATKYSEKGAKGPLFGDPTLQRIQQTMRSMITNRATGITGDLTSLSALGMNFGAVGSAVGSTTTLAFDSAKFDAAIVANPDGVARLLSAFSATATLNGGGGGSIQSISGKPATVPDSGKYTINSNALGDLTVTYQPDNGGALVTSTGTITAGGTNTTLIAGVTITAKPVLVAGLDIVSIGVTEEGIGKTFAEYLSALTGVDGTLRAGTDSAQATIADINAQIATMNARVTAKEAQLRAKFATLETTMARLKGQQASLTQLQNALNPTK
jgi:flagellar hook-associated protein 2